MRESESDRSDGSDGSDKTRRPMKNQRLRPRGGYRKLRSFRTATVIYDATARFCERFVERRSRMVDQMVQAARSGRQNIAEGSRASASSSQTQLRLVNVARASLDELLLDYEDFLRQRRLVQWPKDHPEAMAVRAVGQRLPRADRSDPSDPSDSSRYARWLEHKNPAIVANAIICRVGTGIRDGRGLHRTACGPAYPRASKNVSSLVRARRYIGGPFLSQVRKTNGRAHGPQGSSCGVSILGLHGISSLSGNTAIGLEPWTNHSQALVVIAPFPKCFPGHVVFW